ncbi:MAG: hypothetical protein ACUVRV_00025 [Cyanobacteriota bacterium]
MLRSLEHEAAVFPGVRGSATNALALSVLTSSHGAIYCHPQAHINGDECGAPELLTGGAKIAQKLAQGLGSLPGARWVHLPQANELSIDLPEPVLQALEQAGFQFYHWLRQDHNQIAWWQPLTPPQLM